MEKQSIGHEIAWFKDGQEGLDFLLDPQSADKIDLILLDVNLPRVNGIEILQRVKSTPRIKQVPIVMLTTSNAESDLNQAYDLYVNSYLVKPISFDDIKSMVSQLMQYWSDLNTNSVISS